FADASGSVPEPESLEPDLPEQYPPEPLVQGEQYLLFELSGVDFATPLTGVQSLDVPPRITPLPFAPDWLPGVCSVRGDILSVVDLPRFLSLEPGPRGRAARLLVVRAGREQITVGLLVDRVQSIARFAPGQLPSADPAGGPAFLRQTAVVRDR